MPFFRQMNSEQISAEITEQEHTLASYIDPKLGTSVLSKSTEFYILDLLHQTQFCKMRIYSTGVLPGPFDESNITNLLFPLPMNSYADATRFVNADDVAFADILEWYQPSMAIFMETETYPLEWLARIEHHNPFSEYDFTVVALLA